MKQQLTLQWSGPFIELCMGRLNPVQRQALASCGAEKADDIATAWYLNADLLRDHFNTTNWWAVDDVEHTMGLVFTDRADLRSRLAEMVFTIDDAPVTVDPEAIQFSTYAPETIADIAADDVILRHGTRRPAELRLNVEFTPPFDPSLITIALLDRPDEGLILFDLDYDGHDDVRFTFGPTTYLKPRVVGKDARR